MGVGGGLVAVQFNRPVQELTGRLPIMVKYRRNLGIGEVYNNRGNVPVENENFEIEPTYITAYALLHF